MVMAKTRNLNRDQAGRFILNQASKIGVFTSEVMLWMAVYAIVFAIEKELNPASIGLDNTRNQQLIAKIEEKMVQYLNRYPKEKKYKFTKISKNVYRAFRVRIATGDVWLKDLFKRYAGKIGKHVDKKSMLNKILIRQQQQKSRSKAKKEKQKIE